MALQRTSSDKYTFCCRCCRCRCCWSFSSFPGLGQLPISTLVPLGSVRYILRATERLIFLIHRLCVSWENSIHHRTNHRSLEPQFNLHPPATSRRRPATVWLIRVHVFLRISVSSVRRHTYTNTRTPDNVHSLPSGLLRSQRDSMFSPHCHPRPHRLAGISLRSPRIPDTAPPVHRAQQSFIKYTPEKMSIWWFGFDFPRLGGGRRRRNFAVAIITPALMGFRFGEVEATKEVEGCWLKHLNDVRSKIRCMHGKDKWSYGSGWWGLFAKE